MKFDLLQSYNERGWILGPKEEEKPYAARIEALDHFYSYPPADIDHFLTDRDWENAAEITGQLYDFRPDWIVAHFSNKKLSFFQGAATWISEQNKIRIPLIQLRKKLETNRLLGLYSKQEVLAHEAVHAARMQFDEPLFEEIFAYRTSPNPFRRFFGPLFQRPYEAVLFLFLLLVPIAIEFVPFFGLDLGLWIHLRLLPLLYFAFLFLRLCTLRFLLSCTLRKLGKLLKNPQKRWAIAFRLTDKEILTFAVQSEKKLAETLNAQDSYRWDFLGKNYFQ